MVTFSVARAYPSANELLGKCRRPRVSLRCSWNTHVAAAITSMPSRLVSIFRLSMVRLSTPVARMPKWPPGGWKNRAEYVVAVLEADGLVARAACSASGPARPLSPLPDPARPDNGDILDPSPQIRLLCQWLWP